MPSNVEAKVTHLFKATAERVFDAWLDPIKVRSWSGQSVPGMPGFDVRRVEIDPQVGGRFTFSDMRQDGELFIGATTWKSTARGNSCSPGSPQKTKKRRTIP